MKKNNLIQGLAAASAALALVLAGCSTQRKVTNLKQNSVQAGLALPQDTRIARQLDKKIFETEKRDTIVVTDDETGSKIFFMNAIKDESGEMVANDVISASYVTARFRNVAERLGKIDIEFQVVVPKGMQDSKWQLKLTPDMYIFNECTRLDPVVITGKEYRRSQLRGYQHYDKWVSKIITDSTDFIDIFQLEVFLKRHIPQLLSYKTDTSWVSEEQFSSVFGVSEQEAIDHFTSKMAIKKNDKRIRNKDKMYSKFVKAPITTEGLRLDTVIQSIDGDFVYNYIQTIGTRPKLRNVNVVLSGEVFEIGKKIYTIPESDTLKFYVSSLSAFVDGKERYLTKVIERRAEANTACYIEFEQGKSKIEPNLARNATEIARIKKNIVSLIEDTEFDLDSIVVVSSCSPEGSWTTNQKLSLERSRSVAAYFDKFIRSRRDSLERNAGYVVTLGDDMHEGVMEKSAAHQGAVSFISRTEVENWAMLNVLVAKDTLLTAKEKRKYEDLKNTRNPDVREERLKEFEHYPYIRAKLYPRLRVVRFDFHLHRKGMVKDTVHTTVLDEVYMAGVQAIRDFDYERAITLLRPYNDYNTAVAYSALDYNASALAILEKCERTAQVNYMLAVIYSRQGKTQEAVECYLKSCKQEPSYVHRGNLDPEISVLIKKYNLNVQAEDEFDYSI